MRVGRGAPRRRVLSRLCQLVVIISGLVALLAIAPAAAAEPAGVALNEVNCTGTDWVEVINRSNAEVSLAGWLLTDDALDRVPLRDTHRMRFGADAVLAPGARLVVNQGAGGFPFGLSCGDDTLRLADATDTLVDAVTLPVLATGGMTFGRIPDGTGEWTWTVPTAGTANAVAPDTQGDDPAWLYDPLQVTEIDLEASAAALAQLAAVPDEYVEARITLRNGASTYGPYLVGLRLKGHAAFRPLDGKAAFKVKFGFAVSGQTLLRAQGADAQQHGAGPLDDRGGHLVAAGRGDRRTGRACRLRLRAPQRRRLRALRERRDDRRGHGAALVHGHPAHLRGRLDGEDAIPGRAGEFEVRGRLVHRPLRPGGAVGGQRRRRGRLVGADAAGRRSRRR